MCKLKWFQAYVFNFLETMSNDYCCYISDIRVEIYLFTTDIILSWERNIGTLTKIKNNNYIQMSQ